jgi:hypothetical protein
MSVMTKSMLWTSVFLLGSAVAIAGCGGDDDDSGDAGPVGTGGVGAGTGGVGTGTGGTTGTGGVGTGTGGTTSTGSIMCGTATCMAPGFGGMTFGTPCCVDATAGTCGVQAMDGTCPPPPVSDPRCPGATLGPITVASCCTADNQCGFDASMLMMGCIDLASVASSQLGAILMPPAPRSCDGTGDDGGAPTDNDAGQ